MDEVSKISESKSISTRIDDISFEVADYGSAGFWDRRYMNQEGGFDWYLEYDDIVNIIDANVPLDSRIFVAGCGNSELSYRLYEDGYEDVLSVDFSLVVIDQMQEKYQDIEALTWKQMDLAHIEEVSHSFDVVVDKGALDSILCSNAGEETANKYLQEVERILTEKGTFLCISHGSPQNRLEFLDNDDIEDVFYLTWDVHGQALAKPRMHSFHVEDMKDPENYYYSYICKKNLLKVKKKEVRRQAMERAMKKNMMEKLKRKR